MWRSRGSSLWPNPRPIHSHETRRDRQLAASGVRTGVRRALRAGAEVSEGRQNSMPIRYFLLFCTLATALLATACKSRDYRLGHKQAREDVARDHLMVIVYGLPAEDSLKYYAALKEKYGITVKLGGCVISKEGSEFAWGYNDYADVAIQKRFGAGFGDLLNVVKQELEGVDETHCPPGEYLKKGKLGKLICCQEGAICD